MQEYSERNWPLPDMMSAFPDGWSEIVQEMLPTNECDICGPPLDIGPPPPLPANFQDMADSSGNCNVCHMLTDIEPSPTQQVDASLLPIIMTLFVGMVLIIVTLVVLLVKVKKCRAFFPRGMLCWLFPRNLLPHTELAPSSLPSPSPSTEKLKSGQRLWHGSSRSIQSENIYEVCSPPSQDSLYEEVGPAPPLTKSGTPCSPYGVVLVDKTTGLGIMAPSPRDLRGSIPSTRALLEPSLGIMYQQQAKPVFVSGMPVPHFSTFGGSGRGFFNPAVRDVGNNGFMYPGSAHTLGSGGAIKNATKLTGNQENNQMQKRKLPPVPSDGANFSL